MCVWCHDTVIFHNQHINWIMYNRLRQSDVTQHPVEPHLVNQVRPYCSPPWVCPSTCSIDSCFIWFNPDRPLHTSLCTHTHTQILKDLLWSPTSHFAGPLMWVVVPPLLQFCDLYSSIRVCKVVQTIHTYILRLSHCNFSSVSRVHQGWAYGNVAFHSAQAIHI